MSSVVRNEDLALFYFFYFFLLFLFLVLIHTVNVCRSVVNKMKLALMFLKSMFSILAPAPPAVSLTVISV